MAAVFLAGILTSSFLLTGCGNSTADNSSASSSSSASSASASGDLLEQIQSKGDQFLFHIFCFNKMDFILNN